MSRSRFASLLATLLLCASSGVACHDDSPAGNSDVDGAMSGDAGAPSDANGQADALVPPDGPTVTVEPVETDEILANPGMGFADFHGGAPSPPEHPNTTVAYYRWTWAALEPTDGADRLRDRGRRH